MGQLNLHTQLPLTPPPNGTKGGVIEIPILGKLSEAYQLWHSFLIHLPRLTRYTLGEKIDHIFTDIIEIILTAGYMKGKEKLPLLINASNKLDALKYFVTLLWQLNTLDTNKYTMLSEKLINIGKTLGAWLKSLNSSV